MRSRPHFPIGRLAVPTLSIGIVLLTLVAGLHPSFAPLLARFDRLQAFFSSTVGVVFACTFLATLLLSTAADWLFCKRS
jgi:ABC-type sulfate transport system permease component